MGLRIDADPVKNAQFCAFVQSTGYLTLAEIAPDPKDFPGMDPASGNPGALVFEPTRYPVPMNDFPTWWAFVVGADWRHPLGSDSSLNGLENRLVQIAYVDILS